MEDNIQTIITIIISAFLLFIFPVYMAYEKKDDVSYALAVRYTQDLVDNVRSKGYLSKDMYDDYKARLKVTGNSYDIELTHEYERYDPITNYYTKDKNGNFELLKSGTQEDRKEKEEELTILAKELGNDTDERIQEFIKNEYERNKIYKIENTYKFSSEKFLTNYIESILYSENKLVLINNSGKNNCNDIENNYCVNAYTMNVGDNFNITIKNTNTTLATFIYNMITANTLDSNTRIYVNYGGDILSTKWYGNIDYSTMKHDDVSLVKLQEIFTYEDELAFYTDNKPVKDISKEYNGEYTLTFDTLPETTTVLREKGPIGNKNMIGYNFALGNSKAKNKESTLSVSVGINGISLITNKTDVIEANTQTSLVLPTYNVPIKKTRNVIKDGKVVQEEYTEYETRQRTISDYKSININYINEGRISVKLEGKGNVSNIDSTIIVNDPKDLLNGLKNVRKKNLQPNSIISGKITRGGTNERSSDIEYKIIIGQTEISINAIKYESSEMVIMSHPVTIDSKSNIRIELKKNENDNYVAYTYLNDEFLEESIEMKDVPKVNTIGQTVFGTSNPMYFTGKISNVHLYN